jgi:outer membrane biosynthesis protein TonB
MYIDFQDNHPDIERLERAISRREGVLLSILVHIGIVALILFGPRLSFVQQLVDRQAERAAARQLELEQAQAATERDRQRFVFVAPRIDTPAPAPPPIAELSDQDRVAQAPERSPAPTNPLPFARGNSAERVEAETDQPAPEQLARGAGGGPEPAAGPGEAGEMAGEQEPAPEREPADTGDRLASVTPGLGTGALGTAPVGGGLLGDALRNLQQIVREDSFDNRGGAGGQFGPSIQFDTKGVEFGPWIRRFIAQIKRNWFIPQAAMVMSGHTVLTFNVHKDGSISELQIIAPASIDAFNRSAFNALYSSNPTQPLPPEYPSEQAFFTVTFYYNETPPGP